MAFRILSLDGGGVWCLIQVRALISLYGEAVNGRQVLSDFDLVAGNSGGALVLGGLVEDLTLGEILGYFETEQNRKAFFSPTQKIGDAIISKLTGLGPKYDANAKLAALERLMPASGTTPLSACVTGVRRPASKVDVHLLMTAFDYDRNRATFFRSAAASGPGWGVGAASNNTVAEAIHASTNAPVNYFDGPARIENGQYWDGAIAAYNNPVLAAVSEAIVLGQRPADLAILSIGSARNALLGPPVDSPPDNFTQAKAHGGLLGDLAKLALAINDDPPDAATFQAHVMTGGSHGVAAPAISRVVRMNPLISPIPDPANPGRWMPPGSMTAAQFKYLANNIHLDAIDPAQVAYISTYAEDWLQDLAPNQPLRMEGDTLRVEVGYGRFSEALAAWRAIR